MAKAISHIVGIDHESPHEGENSTSEASDGGSTFVEMGESITMPDVADFLKTNENDTTGGPDISMKKHLGSESTDKAPLKHGTAFDSTAVFGRLDKLNAVVATIVKVDVTNIAPMGVKVSTDVDINIACYHVDAFVRKKV